MSNQTKPYFNILVVDDEPDVLQITKLALRNMSIYNCEIRPICFTSKQETIDYFSNPENFDAFAVALIDVVMESNTAGLELCSFIRQNLNDKLINIYLRTGQPGSAPEASVIVEYDLDGYLSKPELTKEKLFSIVYCGVKNYVAKTAMKFPLLMLNAAVYSLMEEKSIIDSLVFAAQEVAGGAKAKGFCSGSAVLLNGELIAGFKTLKDINAVNELKKNLESAKALPATAEGFGVAKINENGLYLNAGNIEFILKDGGYLPGDSVRELLDGALVPIAFLNNIIPSKK